MLSKTAFDKFRTAYSPAKEVPPERIRNQDELQQLSETEGLKIWIDGSEKTHEQPKTALEIPIDYIEKVDLWAVRHQDVVYAAENCNFGKKLETKMLKHSNLTGGKAAFCGGELLFLEPNKIVVNGRSGRYGPKSAAEMTAIAVAFCQSGYMTWSMGYDTEADQPFPFDTKEPEWVQP